MELGEVFGDGPSPGLADAVGVEHQQLEVRELLGDGLGTGVADVVVG